MSIFGNIMGKIFGHDKAKAAPAPKPAAAPRPAATPRPATPQAQAPRPAAQAAPAPAQARAAPVDVEAVLSQMAAGKPDGGGNWRSSIVDLLKLLDLDSSLEARKELAGELKVNAGAHGSAEQNIALHKAVMRQLAANGGKVPDSLKD